MPLRSPINYLPEYFLHRSIIPIHSGLNRREEHYICLTPRRKERQDYHRFSYKHEIHKYFFLCDLCAFA